jgi:hypothetical protein
MILPVHHPGFLILVLLGALGVSIYRHHQTEQDIKTLCELVGTRAVLYRPVQTTQSETVQTICAQHQQEVYL